MPCYSFIFSLFAFTSFCTAQENTFNGSWELTEILDPNSDLLPKVTEQYHGKRFHFLPEWLIIEDEGGYFLTPLHTTENTADYGSASLTPTKQTDDTLQVSLLDANYTKEFILGFTAAPPLSGEVTKELLLQPTVVHQNGFNFQGFYVHFDVAKKEYIYYRFYPDSTLTRSTSALPPTQMIPFLNQAVDHREAVIFSLAGKQEKNEPVARFSAPPQMEFINLSRIVYQDFTLHPHQDSILVTKTTHYNIVNEPGSSEQFTLTFYPTDKLSYRKIAEPGKPYRINYRSLAGMSSPEESPYYLTDEAPRFPGCEELTDTDERQSCSQKALMTFIYRRLKYPESAIIKGTEGTTIVGFTVQPDGSVVNIKLLRGIGPGCDQE
uniref:energy transducer TonB n=1 Tax=Lewinella sp. TaxID=2004506 RepID=UPI003D6B9907